MFKSKILRFDNAGYFFLGILITAFFGFFPTYFFDAEKPLHTFGIYTHFHATMMTLWFAILITQPFLIRNKKANLHKLLGKASYVFFPLLIISMVLLIHSSLNSAEGTWEGIEFYISLKDLCWNLACEVETIVKVKVH